MATGWNAGAGRRRRPGAAGCATASRAHGRRSAPGRAAPCRSRSRPRAPATGPGGRTQRSVTQSSAQVRSLTGSGRGAAHQGAGPPGRRRLTAVRRACRGARAGTPGTRTHWVRPRHTPGSHGFRSTSVSSSHLDGLRDPLHCFHIANLRSHSESARNSELAAGRDGQRESDSRTAKQSVTAEVGSTHGSNDLAARAAVEILKREGVTNAFSVPSAAINPFYKGAQESGIDHSSPATSRAPRTWPEGSQTHATRGLHRYVRPGRHRHDHRSVLGDRRLDRSCASRVRPEPPAAQGGLRRSTSPRSPSRSRRWRSPSWKAARVPGVFQQAFHLMRSGRPGPDPHRPADRRPADRDRVRRRDVRAAAGLQAGRDPRPDREGRQAPRRLRASADRGGRRHHQRGRERPARRVRRTHEHARRAHPDGLGHHPRRPRPERGHGRPAEPATATATPRSWSRTSSSASATAGPTGTPATSWTCTARAARSSTSTSSPPRSARSSPDYGITSDAKAALELFVEVARAS